MTIRLQTALLCNGQKVLSTHRSHLISMLCIAARTTFTELTFSTFELGCLLLLCLRICIPRLFFICSAFFFTLEGIQKNAGSEPGSSLLGIYWDFLKLLQVCNILEKNTSSFLWKLQICEKVGFSSTEKQRFKLCLGDSLCQQLFLSTVKSLQYINVCIKTCWLCLLKIMVV